MAVGCSPLPTAVAAPPGLNQSSESGCTRMYSMPEMPHISCCAPLTGLPLLSTTVIANAPLGTK